MPPRLQQRAELDAELAHAHGGGEVFRHWTGRLLYTEGVRELAELAGAYWLIDAVASHLYGPVEPEREPFQVWTLAPHPADFGARLECRADSPPAPILRYQEIAFTDFPLRDAEGAPAPFKLYLEAGSGLPVLMLPGEH